MDEVFPVPELLATVLFSGFYLVLGSNAGNALAFAKHILIAASPSIQTTQELDKRLVSFIAISVLTLVCLLHYFSAKLGLFLNKWFAIYKILLLVACFVAGVIARNKSFPGVPSGVTDFLTTQPGYTTADNFAALVYVLYSYQGWENANYVSKDSWRTTRDCTDITRLPEKFEPQRIRPRKPLPQELSLQLALYVCCMS